MRGLRLKVLRCLGEGIKHGYAIAKTLHEEFESVRKILKAYENRGIATPEIGERGARRYSLTKLGEEVLEVAKYIEQTTTQGLLDINQLYSKFDEQVVNVTIGASLGERKVEDRQRILIGPDALPPTHDESVTGEFIVKDILDRGRKRVERIQLKCGHCGYASEPLGVIFPQIRSVLSALLPRIAPLCPECGRLATMVIGGKIVSRETEPEPPSLETPPALF